MESLKVNILLPSVARKPLGGHKVIYEYCNKLAQDGFDIRIYYFTIGLFSTYHIPEPIRIPMVKVFGDMIGPRKWFPLNKNIKTCVIDRAEQMREADIVIATGIETVEPIFKLQNTYGKKAYFIQDYENWNFSDNYVNSSYALGMKNIVVSKWLKNIVDHYSTEPSVLVSNGIDTNVFQPQGKTHIAHSIVFHYRIAPQKGCQYAIETVGILLRRYPDLKITVISNERERPELPTCCKWLFNILPTQVAAINNQSEVFICSTIDEGFGLPGLEAMACGCAVASTDYTGVHEYAIDGYNALLSPVRDPQAMADNVSRLFDDDELREKIVKNGIATGREKSLEKSYQKFKSVLEELVKE